MGLSPLSCNIILNNCPLQLFLYYIIPFFSGYDLNRVLRGKGLKPLVLRGNSLIIN